MASTSQTHPAFPSRPYSSTLHTSSKLPDRSAPLGFGASSHTHTAREAARQERERQERERSAAHQAETTSAASNTMAQLTDEQRDEVNEAVRLSQPPKSSNKNCKLANKSLPANSSASSTSTRTN